MSCVEKRHMNHRMGSMLHHRFPNGFTDLLMDENDREVSTLTDRAFRSLCVGDDAAYNDDCLYGYSPFNCHKPLAGEPKKTRRKESKKQGRSKGDKNFGQNQKSLSNMSSFLEALTATEGSCEGMLIKNGDMADSKGESWDKSALRSIQRELSEFSSDYRSLKDAGFSFENSSKKKNGKSTVKLKKLNIRNFFFHSEFSPFQTWRELNQFPFQPECRVLPTDHIPTWYDMSFYKELTETHRKDSLRGKEEQSCQNVTVDPAPPIAPKPTPPSPPSEILKKPTATPADKSSSSDVGDENSAPWRRNRLRTKSVIPNSRPGITPQENSSKPVEESLPFTKKEVQSVEVKAVEEVSSTASTPFSICQLMTPLIPSRQPTETSEILQGILSPSIHDLPIRPHSEAKLTPELPKKRDSYKSLASSILFNLKDNRKRVKSRYSPPKFKVSEVSGGDPQSPKSDHVKFIPDSSEGNASGLSTPVIPKDGQTVCSPVFESTCTPTDNLTKDHTERPLLDDYLLSNLLQSKKETTNNSVEKNQISPFIQSNIRNPKTKKQNYPSLNLYRKTNQGDSDMKYTLVPPASKAPLQSSQQNESNGHLSVRINKEISPKVQRKNTGLSPNSLKVNTDCLPMISEEPLHLSAGKILPNVPDQARELAKESRETCSGERLDSFSRQDSNGQPISTSDVVRAAKEAIHAAKSKALSAIQAHVNISDREEVGERDKRMAHPGETQSSWEKTSQENSKHHSPNEATLAGKKIKKEPPPVPKKHFANSDIHLSLDKHQEHNAEKLPNDKGSETKLDLLPDEEKYVQKPDKAKYLFSTRQNSYIKSQRYSVEDDENKVESDVRDRKVNKKTKADEEGMLPGEMRDSGHIINDLHALKELERARRRDRVKLGLINVDEEAKAKNDLISRELKNIKKGMMSMRGNTLAKRDLFASKDREQSKHVFPKTDNNVLRTEALVNENYGKAKMILEDFMSECERKKNQVAVSDESHVQRLRQGKESLTTEDEKLNVSTHPLKDLKEKLGDMRDHNHVTQILTQTEPGFSETHQSGSPGRDNNLNMVLTGKAKHLHGKAVYPSYKSEERVLEKESGKNVFQEPEDNIGEAPPVPPRSKKVGNRRDLKDVMEVDSMKSVAAKEIFDGETHRVELTGENLQMQAAVEQSTNESLLSPNKTGSDTKRWDGADKTTFMTSAGHKQAFGFPSTCPQSENKVEPQFHSEDISQNKNKAKALQAHTIETTSENADDSTKGTRRQKKNAPFLPDHLKASDNTVRKNLVTEEPDKLNGGNGTINEGVEASKDAPRDVISPLLSINGTGIIQNPPDQSSQSSKSSYFSVESALYRNAEADVYHSLENLTGEAEFNEEPGNMPKDSKSALDYYCLNDPEIGSEDTRRETNVKSQKEKGLCQEDSTDGETRPPDQGGIPVSPPTTFSPPLGIPALFKVKDNTVINKNTTHPWPPRGSLTGSERGEEEAHRFKENPDLPLIKEPVATENTVTLDGTFTAEQRSSNTPPALLQTPSNTQSFLTVPQEDRLSGVSPSSAVESLTASTADTGDETGLNLGLSKVPSEQSGSTCSGNDSQIGLPKPPSVLPKSEKAVLRALKLTNRRMKKDVQKSTHKSAHSSSRPRAEGHQSNKTEHKSSDATNSKSGGKEIEREKTDVGQHHNKSRNKSIREEGKTPRSERRGRSETRDCTSADAGERTRRQSAESAEGGGQPSDSLPRGTTERQGGTRNRHARDKPQQRHYSTERVISNVPVYKAHTSQRSTPDRTFQRSQSIDRYMTERAERRLSTDMSVNEKLDPRSCRIEKSIMEGFQQRGRSRDKVSREHPLKRSHSIDASHHSTLSRQSSQLSRQTGIERAIVAQSFPVTQRKLLQDPDSGQYFFVDMPIQVKTKTFFDPETGSYVQLPVQPPEGAVTQASTLEVLTPPVVVYHSFVPVPLSPMAQHGTIQAAHTAPQEFEQRPMERSQQMHCKDRQPYLEPIYTQHDHTLGDFGGTEELDCLS